MEMCYLGIFEWVFNQVMDHIFTPVFDFIASIISAGLGFIFEYILGPVVLPILQVAFDWVWTAIQFIYGVIYYTELKFIFSVADYIEKAFDIFIGLEPVTYSPNGYGKGGAVTKSLLEVLFQMDTIRRAFWLITFSGVCIALLLSIYAVARSAFDMDFENKRPVSHVLAQTMKAVVGAFLIPFMALCMIQLSAAILTTLDRAVSYDNTGQRSTIGSTLFVLSSVNAAWDSDLNMSHTSFQTNDDGFGFEYVDEPNEKFDLLKFPRNEFYENDTYNNYKNTLKVATYFNFAKFDLLYAFVGIILIVILLMCLLTFIKRLFEILLLYLISPYFVALMPLDDGEKFKQWFGMFMGKLFTGYGSVVVIKIYLLMVPLFMRGNIEYTNMGRESTFMLYVMFLLGGAWAVYKSGSLLTSLVNEAAGRQEQESMRGAMGMMMMAASPVMNRVQGLMGGITNKMGGMVSGGGGGPMSGGLKKTSGPGASKAKNLLRKGKLEAKSIAKHQGQMLMEKKGVKKMVNWGSRQGQRVQKAAGWTKQQGHKAMEWKRLQNKRLDGWKTNQKTKFKNWSSEQARSIRGTALVSRMEKYGNKAQEAAGSLKEKAGRQIMDSQLAKDLGKAGKSINQYVDDSRFGRLNKSPTLKDVGFSGEENDKQKAYLKRFVERRDQMLETSSSTARQKFLYKGLEEQANKQGMTIYCPPERREFLENQFRCRLNSSKYMTEDGGLIIKPTAPAGRPPQKSQPVKETARPSQPAQSRGQAQSTANTGQSSKNKGDKT